MILNSKLVIFANSTPDASGTFSESNTLYVPRPENSILLVPTFTKMYVEKRLVAEGFHLAWLKNETRFATKEDCERKSQFVSYLIEQYALQSKCVLIGYSCGGAHAVNFAGTYPNLVSCAFFIVSISFKKMNIVLYIKSPISMTIFGTFKVSKQCNIFAIGVVSAKKPKHGKHPTTRKNVRTA